MDCELTTKLKWIGVGSDNESAGYFRSTKPIKTTTVIMVFGDFTVQIKQKRRILAT